MNRAAEFPARLLGIFATRGSRSTVTTLLVVLTAALTAYYTTVYGIRLSLNEKADRNMVEEIDRRLLTIETILRTDIVHRGDLSQLHDDFQKRLTRIETLLEKSAESTGH
jgi:hypothetical protein